MRWNIYTRTVNNSYGIPKASAPTLEEAQKYIKLMKAEYARQGKQIAYVLLLE
jgi:hypothetical protein